MMNRDELVNSIRTLLTKAGFFVSDICSIRPSSFDFFARRDNLLLILKVLNNIDALNAEVAHELCNLASILKGIPLLIGIRSSSRQLEDSVVYYRYNVPIVNYATFEEYLKGEEPLICAAPGGLYVNIDGERLKQKRIQHGVSLGKLSRIVGVSRRTIRMYEKGERASIHAVTQIEEFFGEPFTKSVNFLQFSPSETPRTTLPDNPFTDLKHLNLHIIPIFRCPFDAISEIQSDSLLMGIRRERLSERARLLSNISQVAEKQSFFIVEHSLKTNIEGIPLISKKELQKIKSPEQILELILERT